MQCERTVFQDRDSGRCRTRGPPPIVEDAVFHPQGAALAFRLKEGWGRLGISLVRIVVGQPCGNSWPIVYISYDQIANQKRCEWLPVHTMLIWIKFHCFDRCSHSGFRLLGGVKYHHHPLHHRYYHRHTDNNSLLCRLVDASGRKLVMLKIYTHDAEGILYHLPRAWSHGVPTIIVHNCATRAQESGILHGSPCSAAGSFCWHHRRTEKEAREQGPLPLQTLLQMIVSGCWKLLALTCWICIRHVGLLAKSLC